MDKNTSRSTSKPIKKIIELKKGSKYLVILPSSMSDAELANTYDVLVNFLDDPNRTIMVVSGDMELHKID
jgi:hypothetical protein